MQRKYINYVACIISYCIAFNYDIFLDTYDVDLRRSSTGDQPDASSGGMQQLDI